MGKDLNSLSGLIKFEPKSTDYRSGIKSVEKEATRTEIVVDVVPGVKKACINNLPATSTSDFSKENWRCYVKTENV